MKKISRSFLFFALSAVTNFSFAFSAQAQTPQLVYSDSSTGGNESGNAYKIHYGGSMGTGSLSGNLVTLRITVPHGSTLSSITDNLSDSYTAGVSVDSGSGGWVTTMYYLANAPAGITLITVSYTAAVDGFHYALEEYSGVAASSPVDGTCSNHSTTIACSAAITTTASNDLVVASMIAVGASSLTSNTSSTIAPGGSFIFDAADTQSSDADEEYILATAGSITPSFTVTGNSQAFNTVGMAFKAQSGAGTNPTGMNIRHIQKAQLNSNGNPQRAYFVTGGNLVVMDSDLGPFFTTIGIGTCSPTAIFTTKTEGTYWPYFFYAGSASFTPSTSMYCTVTNSGGGNNGHIVIYDIFGAATSPFDVLSSAEANGPEPSITAPITPTSGPGLIIAAMSNGVGPMTGFSPGIFDNTPYTGETDGGQLNNGDGWGHYFYTLAGTTTTFTWTSSGSGYMQASSIAFDAASGGSQGGPPAPPKGLQATVQP